MADMAVSGGRGDGPSRRSTEGVLGAARLSEPTPRHNKDPQQRPRLPVVCPGQGTTPQGHLSTPSGGCEPDKDNLTLVKTESADVESAEYKPPKDQETASGSQPAPKNKSSKKGSQKGSKQCHPVLPEDANAVGTFGTSRWSHKSQAAHLTPSLLEEVLNEKKMALMNSTQVISHLHQLQERVKTRKASSEESKIDRKCRKHNVPEDGSPEQPPPAPDKKVKTEPPGGFTQTQSSIWSKEASAFTSVASTASSTAPS